MIKRLLGRGRSCRKVVFSNDYLSKTEKESIHSAVCHVLENVGIAFQSDKAVEVFKKHGAKTDGNMIYISEKLLMSSLKNTPRSFKVCGRSKERDFVVGGGAPAFAPASGPVFVKTGNEKKLAGKQDYINLLKLMETSEVVNFANFIVVEPQDMPEQQRKLHQIAQTLAMTTKPLVGMAMGPGMSDKALRLISDFYAGLSENRTIGIISPISPLVYDQAMLEHVFAYAEHRQPLMFASCSLPGATSPVTLAGTVVIDSAQSLAGIVLAQLLRPGLPVLFGSTSCSCDMRFLAPAIGSPETGLISAAIASMSHYYNLPCRTGGTLTDAKAVDAQSGLESAMALLPALSAGADFVLQSVGILDSFNIVSLEKFVFDEDVITFAQRMVKGFKIDEASLATALIGAVGAAGQYFEHDHTFDHYRELYIPGVLSREGYDQWESEGRLSLSEKIAQKAARRLESYQKPYLEPEREKMLNRYIIG